MRERSIADRRTANASAVLEFRHGMNAWEKQKIIREQGECCPICLKAYDESGRKAVFDHKHKPGEKPNGRSRWSERGRLRTVICQRCNMMLAGADDDPQTLCRGADFIEEWNARHRQAEAKEAVWAEIEREIDGGA